MTTSSDRPLVRIDTDFNWREDYLTIVLPDRAPAEVLVPGTRVILYEPDEFECEAIVRRARRGHGWPISSKARSKIIRAAKMRAANDKDTERLQSDGG